MNNEIKLNYYGASLFKIFSPSGKIVVIDPYVTKNPLCKVDPDHFYDADLILITHAASDHFGDTIDIMKNPKATLYCGREVWEYCMSMDIPEQRIVRTNYGQENMFWGIKAKSVLALHSSRIEGPKGTFVGLPMGFILTLENDIRIFHAGDTALYSDLKIIGAIQKPQILLLGVSGVDVTKASELDATEAAFAAQWVNPDIVIPMHYPEKSAAPAKFKEAVNIVAPHLEPVMMEPGSSITYTKYHVKAV